MKKAKWAAYGRTRGRLISEWDANSDHLTVSEPDRRLTTAITIAAKKSIPFGNGGKTREAFWNEHITEHINEHITELKKKMAKRRQCLQALAGKTYDSHRYIIKAAYIGYIRSVL